MAVIIKKVQTPKEEAAANAKLANAVITEAGGVNRIESNDEAPYALEARTLIIDDDFAIVAQGEVMQKDGTISEYADFKAKLHNEETNVLTTGKIIRYTDWSGDGLPVFIQGHHKDCIVLNLKSNGKDHWCNFPRYSKGVELGVYADESMHHEMEVSAELETA